MNGICRGADTSAHRRLGDAKKRTLFTFIFSFFTVYFLTPSLPPIFSERDPQWLSRLFIG